MPQRDPVGEKNEALKAKDLLKAINDGLNNGYRVELKAYRALVRHTADDASTSQSISDLISSTTPANFNALTDAEKLDLLRQNQRDLAFMVRDNLAVLNAMNTWFSTVRGALAKALKHLNRADE